MPWWAAVLIALLGTAIGFALDAGSGNRELSGGFAAFYMIGCVAAVLAVRQEAIFTAVVQPPLILFAAVPGAYFLFHHSEINGIKDILINCGYPLIERFLLMFTTSVIVLLIGMARWYFGAPARAGGSATATKTATTVAGAGLLSGLKAKLAAFTEPTGDDEAKPHKHAIDRNATVASPTPGRRPSKRSASTKSRHVRPPANDGSDAVSPSRRRPTHARDFDDAADGPPPRRRAPRDPNRRTPPPEYRWDPRDPRQPRQRSPYERPTPRPERDDLYPSGDPYETPPPRRQPPAAGSNGTHHPVSRVRYRGSDAADSGNPEDVQYRNRPRTRHGLDDRRYRD